MLNRLICLVVGHEDGENARYRQFIAEGDEAVHVSKVTMLKPKLSACPRCKTVYLSDE